MVLVAGIECGLGVSFRGGEMEMWVCHDGVVGVHRVSFHAPVSPVVAFCSWKAQGSVLSSTGARCDSPSSEMESNETPSSCMPPSDSLSDSMSIFACF